MDDAFSPTRAVAASALFLLCGACAVTPLRTRGEPCAIPCVAGVERAVSSCDHAADSLQRARDLLTAELIPPSHYCRAFSSVRLVERVERSWRCREFAQCEGEYDPATRTILIGAGMRGLMHELLHHYETGVLGKASLNHRRWQAEGYFRLIDDYVRTHPPPALTP